MLDPFRTDDGFRRRPPGMALSTRETRGAHHRREERHRRIAGCAVFEGVVIQTGHSRSLGNPARTVTAAQSCRGMTKHECRVELIIAGEIRVPSRKTVALSLFPEASWIRSICPGAFHLTKTGNPNRMRS